MKSSLFALLCACVFWLMPARGDADTVTAQVDISEQTMQVFLNGEQIYTWLVSTARSGKYTPRGTWTAKGLSRYHRSSIYDNAPMPHSIFFAGNYAIHGTNQISSLGTPVSAGCVRLHPDNAAILYEMTRSVGLKNMQVVIQD